MNTKDSHKAMYVLIEQFGTAVTDMFEQMIKGSWMDDHGHDVKNNAAMHALKPLVERAIALRAEINKEPATSSKTITIKGLIHKSPHREEFSFYEHDMTEYGDLVVGPYSIEYEIPASFNPVVAEVSMLNKKLDSINKEHTDKVITIKSRIQELLCIENNPTPNSEDVSDAIPF